MLRKNQPYAFFASGEFAAALSPVEAMSSALTMLEAIANWAGPETPETAEEAGLGSEQLRDRDLLEASPVHPG